MPNWLRNSFFIFGIACVVLMAWRLDAGGQGFVHFRHSAWPYLPLVLAVWIPTYLFNALAYRTVVNLTAPSVSAPRLPYWDALRLTVSGFAFSYITPMGFGGLPYRIMELREQYGTSRATASTLLYSMTHVLSHFLLWTTAVLIFPIYYSDSLDSILTILFAIFLLVAITVFVLFLKGVKSGIAQKVVRVMTIVPLLRSYVARHNAHLSEAAKRVDDGLAMLHRAPRAFLKALACEYIARLINTCEFLFILAALGHAISYPDALMIMAFSSLVGNLFFFLPLQLGAREGGVAIVMSLLGLPLSTGIYTSFYTRVREIFWVAIGVLLIKFYKKGCHDETSYHTL